MKHIKSSIFSKAKKYSKYARLKFHTPGHNGRLCKLDLTEIDEGEVFPADSIELAQDKAAQIYKSKFVRFLTNGSSMGIKAAIMASNSDIIAWNQSHCSVFEGAELARQRVVCIEGNGFNPPQASDYVQALKNNPLCRAVVVTNPTYLGFYIDQSSVYDYCLKNNIILITDSAHGAHFGFSSLLPYSAAVKSDICIMSAHKTLPALTQSSLMTVNNKELLKAVDNNLKLLSTTSPSYLLLGSIEYALEFSLKYSHKYQRLYKAVNDFKKRIPTVSNQDFTRLVVDAKALNLSGEQLNKKLISKNIYCEKVFEDYIVFIITLNHKDKDLKKLAKAIL